jgi:hypothetical protein
MRGLRRAIALTSAAALCLIAAPTAGATVYQATGVFPVSGLTPSGVAVNQGTHDIYVSNLFASEFYGSGNIVRLDSEGNELGSFSSGEQEYDSIALAPSGEVYASDGQHQELEAFSPEGAPIEAAPFPMSIETGFFGNRIDTDSSGNAYIPNGKILEAAVVNEYSSADGSVVKAVDCTECPAPAEFGGVTGTAVDSSGNIYVATEGVEGTPNRVVKFDSSGHYLSTLSTGEEAPHAVAVDKANDRVFVGLGAGTGYQVLAFDSEGNQLADFGAGEIAGEDAIGAAGNQIAVDSASGVVYVLDRKAGASRILVYSPLPEPTASTEAPSAVGDVSATLNGTVSPKGETSLACQFEYTTQADFEANEWVNAETAACEPEPMSEETDVAVSTQLEGLSPLTAYAYRAVEETAGGVAAGEAVQFTTLPPAPQATTEAASGISQTAATLHGSVDAEGGEAGCEFEYGLSTAYGHTASCSVTPVAGTAATAVSAALSGLSAGTAYHFRVVAESEGGTGAGEDMTFSTAADTCTTNAALCPPASGGGGSPAPAPAPEAKHKKAGYGRCISSANKAYTKALKAAKKKHGKARARALKAARKKKGKLVDKCRARFHKRGTKRHVKHPRHHRVRHDR